MTCRPATTSASRTILRLREELVWGTPSAHDPIGVDFSSEGFSVDHQHSAGRHDMEDGRAAGRSSRGRRDVRGSIAGALQPNGPWPIICRHALGGTPTTTAFGEAWRHVILGADALPVGLTVEKIFDHRDGSTRFLQYVGCRVGRLGLRIEQGAIAVTANFVGGREIVNESDPGTTTYAAGNEPYTVNNALMYMDIDLDGTVDAIATIQSFDLAVDNDLDPDDYQIENGADRRRVPIGNRAVSGGFRAMFTPTNWQMYEHLVEHRPFAVRAVLSRGDHSWQIDLPRIRLRSSGTPQVGGAGPIALDFTYTAERDNDAQTDVSMTIVNDDPVVGTS